jgi:hypothetical protein
MVYRKAGIHSGQPLPLTLHHIGHLRRSGYLHALVIYSVALLLPSEPLLLNVSASVLQR